MFLKLGVDCLFSLQTKSRFNFQHQCLFQNHVLSPPLPPARALHPQADTGPGRHWHVGQVCGAVSGTTGGSSLGDTCQEREGRKRQRAESHGGPSSKSRLLHPRQHKLVRNEPGPVPSPPQRVRVEEQGWRRDRRGAGTRGHGCF